MPMRSVDIHALAEQELRSAYRWYRGRSQAAAGRFQRAVQNTVQRIMSAAEQGAPFGRHYRWLSLRRFPYAIYYQIRDPLPVLIYAAAHASRRPGYWLRRTRP